MKTVAIEKGTSLAELYRSLGGEYPKFFKMDIQCKLGYLLVEKLLQDAPDRFVPRKDVAVLVFSRSGSLADDKAFAATLDTFPSPAHFVYTLPNTVCGEIAIRNRFMGETRSYVLDSFDPEILGELVLEAFLDEESSSVIAIWADAPSEEEWEARAWLFTAQDLMPAHHCCHHGEGGCHHGEGHHEGGCCHGEGHGEGSCCHGEGHGEGQHEGCCHHKGE